VVGRRLRLHRGGHHRRVAEHGVPARQPLYRPAPTECAARS
jgi:hypothetical protein